MASQHPFQSSSHSGFLPPVMVEKGKWAWHEPSGQLIFQKSRQSRMSRRKSRPWLSSALLDFKQEMKSRSTGVKETTEERTITLDDVKAVAVSLVSEDLIKKMKKKTAMIFDECYRTDQMNNFLWSVLRYFQAFLEHDKAKCDENVYIPGSLGLKARQRLKKCEYELRQRQMNLGHTYMSFVLGLGHSNSHHTRSGRSKVSKTYSDQHLYETIYEFTMYVTWITFGYDHWKAIHDEIGSNLRTTAFNKDFKTSDDDFLVEVDGFGTIFKDSDEYLSYKIVYDRPTVGSLRSMRSPIMVNYFPSSKEKSSWAFDPPYKPSRKWKAPVLPKQESPPDKLGIIGRPISEYDPSTLRYIDRSDSEEEESGSESEDEESSEIGRDVYEDYKSEDVIDISDDIESEMT